MDFDSKIPIHLQLHDYFQKLILSGKLAPGMPIPSLRKIASTAQVNTSTVQRAVICLLDEGLVEKHKRKGYSVIQDQEKIKYRRRKLVQYTTQRFLHEMKALGYDRQKIIEVVFQYSNDNSDYGFENQMKLSQRANLPKGKDAKPRA